MKRIIAFGGWALFFMACSTGLKYPYYGMEMSELCYDESTLLGVDGGGSFDPDLNQPMASCKNYECLVMKTLDHERLETDLAACRVNLEACEEK